MARVYVSSTVADLKRERRAVIDWLVAEQHQVVHSYRPNSNTVRASCLDDVDTCDLYVLIVGHRYGFQPPKDNPEGLSITQLEFRRAGQSGIPRVALLRTSIPDERLSDIDDPQKWPLVRAFRAEVADQVRAAEFRDLRGLVQWLSTGVHAELARLGKPADGDQADRRAPGPVLRLAPRPEVLVGREELLAALHDRLATGDGSGPRVVALVGLGGAGKTSLAVEYAHRHLNQVGVAWQLPAEDATVLAAGFTDLAAQLGASVAAGAGDPVVAVHSALAAYPGEWLLIFDNVPRQGAVRAFLPPAGNGRVLITSQSAVWPQGQAVPIPVLGTEVAAVFLVTRSGDPDRQAAAALAEELGGLPLALEQAGAYVETAGITLAGYLSVFADRRADLLARGQAPAGHPADVAATLGLALSGLGDEDPAAAGLLRLLACLSPEPVPLAPLLSGTAVFGQLAPGIAAVIGPLLGDPVAAGAVIAALRQYSLVTPAEGGLVLVHRLVQAITLAQLPADVAGQWKQAAAVLVEAAIPADPGLPAAWPVCAMLLPHARAALSLTSGGMWRIAVYLGASGSYPAARDLFERIADARREDDAYGPEHPDTLGARSELARWTGDAGDAAAARDEFAALLPIRERVLGPEDRDTLTTRHNLAYYTGVAGDAAAARDQFAALLPIRERVLGPEDPETLTTRHNLAYYTGVAGDAATARDQTAALLPIEERVLGPEHPDTLTTRHNLASWTENTGDAAGARDQFAALLPIRERVLGAEHPDTLATRHNLAYRTGDAAGTRDRLAGLFAIEERVLGPEHPDTLAARADIALFTGQAGDAVAARDQFAALLAIRERVLGPEHPDTLATRHSLARWTRQAGDAAAARDQFAALLAIRERVLGPEHRDTLTTRGNLARCTGQAGDAAGARDQFVALLPSFERVLGPEHTDTLTIRSWLVDWTEKAAGGG
jgi:hypothetical protein